MIEKLYNEKGQVGIAVSYGYGAGWSTWNDVSALDKRYNELVLNKNWDEAFALADKEGHYTGGLRECVIEWVDEGTMFIITEYDGSEGLENIDTLSQTA